MEFRTFKPTQTQQGVLENTAAIGNLCAVFRLPSKLLSVLDEKRLEAAIKTVIYRTEPFSYRFVKMGESLQVLQSTEAPEALRVIDMASEDETHAFQLIRSLCTRSFRLDGGSPYLFSLLKGGNFQYFVFSCHPALIDRFSLKSLFQMISDLYNGKNIPELLGLSQEELIAAETQLVKTQTYSESVRFWVQLLKETSFDWKPTRLESELSDTYFSAELPSVAADSLSQLADELKVDLGELLLFCFHLFLFRMTRNEMVVTSHHHRIASDRNLDSKKIDFIGFNETKVALKSQIQSHLSARKFFKNAKRLFGRISYHSDFPVYEVYQEFRRENAAFERVTNVIFDEDSLPYKELCLDGENCTLLPFFSHRLDSEDFSIYFERRSSDASDKKGSIAFHVLSRSPQFTSGMKIAFQHYLTLLANIRADIDKPISSLKLFTDDTRKEAIQLAEGGPLKIEPRDVVESFFSIADQYPQYSAVKFGQTDVSYGEMATKAKRIAKGLIPYFESNSESLIGLCLSRSENVVQSIFGVLSSGAAYVPLDPKMPDERFSFIVKDSGLSAVVVDRATAAQVQPLVNCPIIHIDSLLNDTQLPCANIDVPVQVGQNRAAYVIYTSGTTGKPKGVVLERGMVSHYVAAMEGVCERDFGSRWLQLASFTFDASVLEIFNSLTRGGQLVIAPEEVRTDPEALFTFLKNERITHAFLPPALLLLLPRKPLPDLKGLFFGGEALDEEACRFWSKVIELGNCYGPTETTVMATFNILKGYKAAVDLGRPLRGYKTYILDEGLELTPIGGVGEICIGGNAVARAYLGRPELTSQKFIPNPFGEGRLYRTGDLARYLPNGELEFLGRNDFQVKIRGFRIELPDIENVISEQPEVNGCHVAVIDHVGTKALTAWYVSSNLSPEVLRTRISDRLPHYMVPAFLVRMKAFPLNINGKIDRTRLPAPRAKFSQTTEVLDDYETQVREIWAKILKVNPDSIGLESHFFHLGGHSLLAALVCSRVSMITKRTVGPKVLFEFPVFADFCAQSRSVSKSSSALRQLEPTNYLSAPVESQIIKLVYSRARRTPDDNAYNVVTQIDFSGDIHPLHLRQALRDIISENLVFLSEFIEIDNSLHVQVKHSCPIVIPLVDATDATITERIHFFRRVPLSLHEAPLWRAEILCTEKGRTVLLLGIHHSIFDGWSLNLLLEELNARYEAIKEGKKFLQTRLTWFDYCHWAKGIAGSQSYLEALSYWREKMKGATARIELPLATHQKKPNSNIGKEVRFSPHVARQLKQFADSLEITLPPLFFSLYLIWLWRLSNQEDLICAYPCAGRDLAGTQEIYGSFVCMPFLRQAVRAEIGLKDLALAVHRQMIEDKENLAAAPYEAEIPGMDSLNVIFSLQTGIDLEGKFSGSYYKIRELPSETSKGDLAGVFYHSNDGTIEGRIEFDSSVFQNEMIDGFTNHFVTLVSAAASNPSLRVGEIPFQSEAQLRRVLELSSGKELDIPDMSIAQRFRSIAAKYPHQTAVVFGNQKLSYRDLDSWSDQIAANLPNELTQESCVGLSITKSETLVAALLGVLKRGCAYVPLDSSYPATRLKYFAANSGLQYVVSDEFSAAELKRAGLSNLTFIFPVEDRQERSITLPPVSPNALAYIIYTSGSTGTPKGVMIENASVVRMIAAAEQALGPQERGCLIASLNFDASVLEIFLQLLTGGTLVVMPEEVRKDPKKLHQALHEYQIGIATLSPVVLQSLPRENLPHLKIMAFGGDTLDETTAQWWSQQTRLFSLYGPTETTVMASLGEIPPGGNSRTIGRPLSGYRTYILNQQKQPVPIGAVGEICIGGEGAARGYLDLRNLTMERFVTDPFGTSPYDSLYLSGDLGRFLPNGNIEFLGRNDNQIKLRGFRIELGEIEHHLSQVPGMGQVVCTISGEGEHRHLVAYYILLAGQNTLEDEILREHLKKFLPDYMIPSFFVETKSFPVTPSGKIDRKALPSVSTSARTDTHLEGLEKKIAEIWESVLQFQGIRRDDNFFHLGGNSLLAVRMQSEIKRKLGIQVSLTDFYQSPTVQALASRQEIDPISQAIQDAQDPLLLRGPIPEGKARNGSDQSALLTGATGFLGIFLLQELCKKVRRVYCLIRCDSLEHGRKLLGAQAQTAGLTIDFSKVEVVPGDLSERLLGIESTKWEKLADEIDVILHCGALVHHLHGYSHMKPANVGGTRELLALALEKKMKPFCFISTLTAGAIGKDTDSIKETVLPNPPVINNGYILSKWVGEQLVGKAAHEKSLPVLIARPGNIVGDSKSGFSNYEKNHFWLFNQGCLQLGSYPDTQIRVEMTPVDILAEAIVSLFLSHQQGLKVANLNNPKSLSQGEFFQKLSQLGFEAKPEAPAEWQKHLTVLDEKNALSTLKDLYMGDLSGEMPQTEQSQTLSELQKLGMSLETDYDTLLGKLCRNLPERPGLLGQAN